MLKLKISRGRKLINDDFIKKLSTILNDIKSGNFNEELKNNNVPSTYPNAFKNLENQTKKILKILKDKKHNY